MLFVDRYVWLGLNLIMMPNFIHTAMCGASIGLMDTGFSLFLAEKFKLDEFQIGLLFVPSSVSYMMVGFLVGYLTDKRFFSQILVSSSPLTRLY